MRLRLNQSLRKALSACVLGLLCASTLGSMMFMPKAIGAIVYNHSSGQLTNQTDSESVTLNVTGGWIGGRTQLIEAPIIYVQNWIQTAASRTEYLIMNGDLTSLEGGSGTGDVVVQLGAGFTDDLSNRRIFNGDHQNFSGDFIVSMAGGGTSSAFVFTNTDSAHVGDYVNVSGTGALEFGVRTEAVDGLGINRNANNVEYFYTGTASIGNSSIKAASLSLNGASSEANNSAGYGTSFNAVGTNGADYSISSDLTLTSLDLRDESNAVLTGASVSINTVNLYTASSSLTLGASVGGRINHIHMQGAGNSLVIEGAGVTVDAVTVSAARASIAFSTTNSLHDLSIGATGSSVSLSSASGVTGSIIGSDLGDSSNSISIAADSSIALGGTHILSGAGQIVNEGTLIFNEGVTFDIDALTWSTTDNINYTLQLIANSGTLSGFTSENIMLDFQGGLGLDFTFDSATGTVSYQKATELFYNAAGEPFTWSTDTSYDNASGGTSTFQNGNNVTFNASATVTIGANISAPHVTIASGATVTMSAEAGSILSSGNVEIAGTLELTNTSLASNSHLTFVGDHDTGGSLNLAASMTQTVQALHAENNAMILGGAGTLIVNGTLLEGASSTRIRTDATLRINAGSNSEDVKSIYGAGTLQFAGNDGVTFLNVDNFTGAVELLAGAGGIKFDSNQDTGARFALTAGAGVESTIGIYGVEAPGSNGLLLSRLEGDINFESQTTNTYRRVHVDLEMSQDNTWSGTWRAANNNDGYLVVGTKAGESSKTLTITNGLQGVANNGTYNRLEIQNATVKFIEDANWRSSIVFTEASSTLILAGQSIEFFTETRESEVVEFQSESAGAGHIIVNMGDQTATVSRTNDDYSGTISVASGTLKLNAADAFASNTTTISVSGGVLDMTNKAQGNAVTMTGGTLTNATAWTGSLTVNNAEADASPSPSTVMSSTLTSTSITLAEGATLKVEDSVLSATGTEINAGASAAGTVHLVDSTIQFAEGSVTVTQPTATASTDMDSMNRMIEETTLDLNTMLKMEFATNWNISEMIVEGTLYFELNLSAADFDLFHDHVLTTGVAFAFNEGGSALDISGAKEIYIGLKSGDDYELHRAQGYGTSAGGVSYALVVPVPEPSSVTLSLLALTGLLARRRRAKQS